MHFLLLGGVQHPLGHFSGRMACGDDTRGLDLNPIDVRDPDATLWLRALVWPDEVGRAELLQQAAGGAT